MSTSSLHRLTAFSHSASGGNRAGVWLGEQLPAAVDMQRIATEVGYSETAFVAPMQGADRVVRYFSPAAEVSFCGHATIAAGVVLGQHSGAGRYRLSTSAGDVLVDTSDTQGQWQASLLSVAPRHAEASPELVAEALRCLGWTADDLDPTTPPALAYAGAWHLVLASADAATLARLEYPFETLRALMQAHDLTTLQLIRRIDATHFESRNPFPVGGVVEDAATGAAAAALGGYLRDAGLLDTPAKLEIRQGHHMGRPSLITVEIPVAGGVRVGGQAVRLTGND
jgi:PhzF family phenazine biosynthesis protein